ncbi:MAG: YhbY family RNA-binding protein [Desulfococcaceae bacterium]|jgi:RNA-binding protein|nr:YhbY family RNA-binding protein [Desulfococcaceae bacterium]
MLKGFQKKYLRGLAHDVKPVVTLGQRGITETLLLSVNDALNTHELIKIKFNDFKEKAQKEEIMAVICQKTGGEMAGMIGHVAILYRRHPDPEKRKISLPEK